MYSQGAERLRRHESTRGAPTSHPRPLCPTFGLFHPQLFPNVRTLCPPDEPFWGSKKFVIWVQNIAQHFTRQGPISSVTSIFRPNRKKLCDTECFVFARFARERTV